MRCLKRARLLRSAVDEAVVGCHWHVPRHVGEQVDDGAGEEPRLRRRVGGSSRRRQAVMVTLSALLMECASAGMEADGSEMSVRGLQEESKPKHMHVAEQAARLGGQRVWAEKERGCCCG